MKFVNNYLLSFKPYTLASHKIWEDDSFDSTILKLDWNEATIPPSPVVIKRIMNLVSNNQVFNFYPNTDNKELRNLLSKYIDLPDDYFEYFSSSDAVQEHLVRLLLKLDDKVLILGPTYDNFRVTCESQGAKCIIYEADLFSNEYLFEFNEYILEYKPKIVYICNPNNPTGGILSVQIIEELLNNHKTTLFIIDEAYYEFSGLTVVKLVPTYNNLIVTRTFSKSFALANFRAGYTCSSIEIISELRKIKNYKNIPSITQEAIIGALQDLNYMWGFVDEVNLAKDSFIKDLQGLSFVKHIFESSANFVLIELESHETKQRLDKNLQSNKIYVRSLGHSRQLINCLRISIGTVSQMNRVVEVFKNFR